MNIDGEWWETHFGWFPVQFCPTCGRVYWRGLPRREAYCSRECWAEDQPPGYVPDADSFG